MKRHPGRTASMHWGFNAFLASALALVLLIALLWKSQQTIDRTTVYIYVAAGLKAPVEEIIQEYKREFDIEVKPTYGGSGDAITSAKFNDTFDLFLPADYSYIKTVRDQNLLEEDIPVAFMKPVVGVQKGNPKQIKTLDDLLRKDVTVVLANPEVAAVGKLTKAALQKTGKWEPLRKKAVMKGTVANAATDVRIGEADAAIVWDATVIQFGKHLDAVVLEELKGVSSSVTVGVLKACKTPPAALRFARYLTARDKGLSIFARHGFVPLADGDLWANGEPEIEMLVGAMIQPAIKQTVTEFAEREGLPPRNIRIKYNGCGILVAQMKASERPDGFFACDARYFDDALSKDPAEDRKIKDLFLETTEVSTNKLVMVVHKGNPKKILRFADLARKGMRIGAGDPDKCAMGWLTQRVIRQGNLVNQFNVINWAATGDMLVNQFLAAPDEMDAIVVYSSNALRLRDRFDIVEITDSEEMQKCAVVTQPIAVGKDSNHKYLVRRLIRAITSEDSRKRFEENAFQWKATR